MTFIQYQRYKFKTWQSVNSFERSMYKKQRIKCNVKKAVPLPILINQRSNKLISPITISQGPIQTEVPFPTRILSWNVCILVCNRLKWSRRSSFSFSAFSSRFSLASFRLFSTLICELTCKSCIKAWCDEIAIYSQLFLAQKNKGNMRCWFLPASTALLAFSERTFHTVVSLRVQPSPNYSERRSVMDE